MNNLSDEQRTKFSTVLMEYLNAGDWKALFVQTDCEEFAQQNTQFYEDVSWENETLEQDCEDALAFILQKDSKNLKVIWELPGVQTMTSRKDESLKAEIEALVESTANVIETNNDDTYPDFSNANQNPYKALDDAEILLDTNEAVAANDLMQAALLGFLQQLCTNKEISSDQSDSVSTLLSKVNDHIKRHADISVNEKTHSMLRSSMFIINTIDDLRNQPNMSNQNDSLLNKADMKFAINLVRSVMMFIDECVA